jgi:hypothetical protein
MLKFTLQPVRKDIALQSKKVENELKKLPQKATEFFKYGAPTPIKSGNARRNTGLIKDSIVANYPYAGRLDEGYSKQAPDGMSQPTLEYIQRTVARIMKGGRA